MNMQLREVGPEFDAATVNELLPFTQSTPYFLWNTNYGREGHRFVGSKNGQDIFFVQFFVYSIHRVKILYAPLGPITAASETVNESDMEQFTAFLSDTAKIGKYSFARIHSTDNIPRLKKITPPLTRGSFMQPQYDRIILLDEEYVIPKKVKKIVEKAGKELSLEVSSPEENSVNNFLTLLKETGWRKSLSLHSERYYRELFNLSHKNVGYIDLLFAVNNGRRIATAAIAKNGKNATYLFGATSREGEKNGAQYFLQTSAIQRVKQTGMHCYSFGGCMKNLDNKKDPFYGVSFFKQKFGGSIKDYGDSYDMVVNKIHYKLYTMYKFLKRNI